MAVKDCIDVLHEVKWWFCKVKLCINAAERRYSCPPVQGEGLGRCGNHCRLRFWPVARRQEKVRKISLRPLQGGNTCRTVHRGARPVGGCRDGSGGIRQASSQQHRSGFSGPACHSDHSLNYYQLFPGKEGKRSRKIYQLPIPSNQGLRYPSGYLRLLCRVDRPASGLPGHSLRGRRPHHGNFSAYPETGGGNRLGLPPLAP